MKPFTVNGWTISPCSDTRHGEGPAFDVVSGDQRYHYDGLTGAVDAAQNGWPGEAADPVTQEVSDSLLRCVEEARRGGGIEGGMDYTLRDLETIVRDVVAADREGR